MSVTTIRPDELQAIIQSGKPVRLIDVRTRPEYESVHAKGAELLPLSDLDPKAFIASLNGSAGDPVYVICKAGSRAADACRRFQKEGFRNVISVEGGTDAWLAAKLPVVNGSRKMMSLERQVRIVAGSLVLVGLMLGWKVHPVGFGLSAFVGAGLVFAGVTDFCGMGLLLARMPWNK